MSKKREIKGGQRMSTESSISPSTLEEYTFICDYSRSLVQALVCFPTCSKEQPDSPVESKISTECITDSDVAEGNEIEKKISCDRQRDRLFLWQILLHDFLSGPGGSLSGMMPVLEMPPPLIDTLKPQNSCVEDLATFVKNLPVYILHGSDVCVSDSAEVSIEGLESKMDWSLSTSDPTQRTRMFQSICESERYVLEKREDQSVLENVMKELEEWSCSFEEMMDAFASSDHRETVPKESNVLGNDQLHDHGTAPANLNAEDSINHHMDLMHQLGVEIHNTRKRPISDLSSSLDLVDGEVRWEHLCFVLPLEWICIMQESVNLCGTLIRWETISDRAKKVLVGMDFARSDDQISLLESSDLRDVFSADIESLVSECSLICSSVLHHGIQRLSDYAHCPIRHLHALKPSIDTVMSEELIMGRRHPKLEMVKNTVITYSTLSPNSKQLLFVEKKSWDDLYTCLFDVNISVFQISIPHHSRCFGRDPTVTEMWRNFDCFFISTDEETMKATERSTNQEFFKFFHRVVMVESDPSCITRTNHLFKYLHGNGTSICFIEPNVSDISLTFDAIAHAGDEDGHYENQWQDKHLQEKVQVDLPDISLARDINYEMNSPCSEHEFEKQQHMSLGDMSAVRNPPQSWIGPVSHCPPEDVFCSQAPDKHWQYYSNENYIEKYILDDGFDRSSTLSGLKNKANQSTYATSFFGTQFCQQKCDFINAVPDPLNKASQDCAKEDTNPFGIGENMFLEALTPPPISSRQLWQPDVSYTQPLSPFSHQPDVPMEWTYKQTHSCSPKLPPVLSGMSPGWLQSGSIAEPTRFQDPSIPPSPPVRVLNTPGTYGSPRANTIAMSPRFWRSPINAIESFRHIEKMYDDMRSKRRAKHRLRRGEQFKKFK